MLTWYFFKQPTKPTKSSEWVTYMWIQVGNIWMYNNKRWKKAPQNINEHSIVEQPYIDWKSKAGWTCNRISIKQHSTEMMQMNTCICLSTMHWGFEVNVQSNWPLEGMFVLLYNSANFYGIQNHQVNEDNYTVHSKIRAQFKNTVTLMNAW